jgi:hypothetical protein
MMNQAGRFMISYLAGSSSMLSDTGTNAVEYGLLAGPVFLVPNAVA